MEKSTKKFLKKPHPDGGTQQLKDFLRKNLVYPEEALRNKVEGDVIVKFKVSGRAEISDAYVEKSLGYGCDEEALRLVNLLKFQAVKNRGIRVITNNRIKIPFRLPVEEVRQKGLNYNYVATEKEKKKQKTENSYNYTIKINYKS